VINLQDITRDISRLLTAALTGVSIYNEIAPYDRVSPYGVFTLVETSQRAAFGGAANDDHVLALTVRLYASRDEGAGALRRTAHSLILALHRARPTLTGLAGVEVMVRPGNGSVSNAGNNLWGITTLFSITGSATGA